MKKFKFDLDSGIVPVLLPAVLYRHYNLYLELNSGIATLISRTKLTDFNILYIPLHPLLYIILFYYPI